MALTSPSDEHPTKRNGKAELRQQLLDEGYVPRAMQDDHGAMVEIPESIRRSFAERLAAFIQAYCDQREQSAKLAVWKQILGDDLHVSSDDWISLPVDWVKNRLGELTNQEERTNDAEPRT